MAKAKEIVRRAGSAAGFHYVNLYQLCPRKFFFRYVLRWQPQFTPAELIQGTAFHEGKAEWYTKKAKSKALAVALSVIEEAEPELAERADYLRILERVPILLERWIDTWGKRDLEEFKVVAVEKELKVPLGQGFVFTLRPDAILRSKQSGLNFIMETKTSGFSKRITEEAVYYGDQATAYIWGVEKVMGIPVYGVQPDIAYWNKQAKDVANIDFPRTPIVTRTPRNLDVFEAGTMQLMQEITQRSFALEQGLAPEVLFPRNSFYCVAYGKVCEYALQCGENCTKATKVPRGFVKDNTKRNPGAFVADSLAVRG